MRSNLGLREQERSFVSPGCVSRLSEFRSFEDGRREGDEGRRGEMERRLVRMRADIANVSAHLEQFARWAGAAGAVGKETRVRA